MFFEYNLTVPANTPATSPVADTVDLAVGTIVGVAVQFPRGCVGLVHAQIWREQHQVWPVNLDGDIAGENAIISWEEEYDLDDKPFQLTLRGWNLDDSFPHTVTFRFNLLSADQAAQARSPRGLLARLARAVLGE